MLICTTNENCRLIVLGMVMVVDVMVVGVVSVVVMMMMTTTIIIMMMTKMMTMTKMMKINDREDGDKFGRDTILNNISVAIILNCRNF